MFRRLRIAVLALTAVLMQSPYAMADSEPVDSRAFPSRPLILVQHSAEYCTAGCERKYQFCVNVVNENALDDQIRQLGLDGCERNYQKCVKDCS